MDGQQSVVLTDHRFSDVAHERDAAIAGGAAFSIHQCASADEVRRAIAGANVVVVQFAPVDAAAIATLPAGARIIRYGVGYDNIDIAAAHRAGIEVAYVPDYCMVEVAEHTLAMTLALLRRLPGLDRSVRAERWNLAEEAADMAPFSETSVGFLGLGRIGKETLKRLRPLGFSLMMSDPALDAGEAGSLGGKLVSKDELLAAADVLLLHLPLSSATRHVIDAQALQRMKRGAFIVNTARGGLIDEAALAAALHEGRLAGAGMDVFEAEPLPMNSPLRSAPGIVLSPHAAWYSTHAVERLQSCVADEIRRALAGEPPRCPVNVAPGTP